MILKHTQFVRHVESNQLVGEASDFSGKWLQQDNLGDFIRIQDSNGEFLRFNLVRTEYNGGDLVAWHFASQDRKMSKVVIFND